MPDAAVHLELVFSRPETTLGVTRGAARLMIDMGYAPLCEVTLPNGRRADVMALGVFKISQLRHVMGMRMPRPMALLNASLAEKRVAK